MNDNAVMISNLILKEITFFALLNFDDIHKLMVAKMKKKKPETRNNLILEKRLIKKICEKPKALNHK